MSRTTLPKKNRRSKSRGKNLKAVLNQKDEEGSIRLNRLIARHGVCSRRKADEWIEQGRVAIDGVICKQVGIAIKPEDHTITIDGKILDAPPPLIYLAFHKPKGVVTTKHDPQGRVTVMELLPKDYVRMGVFPVGRLDRDSEGLILLTNDGEWSKKLQHPRHQVWKKYLVEVDQLLNQNAINRLEKGMMLDGRKTLPAKVQPKRFKGKLSKKFILEIREGRNRQVRRMCKKTGMQVKSLKRIGIGNVALGKLQPGECRRLSGKEAAEIADTPKRETKPKPAEEKA